MLLGYNTNGLAHHDLLDAIELLSEIGYRSVAITLDHGALNPFDPRCGPQLQEVRRRLREHQMRSVIETGARYLLDYRTKHEPTLLTDDVQSRRRRIDFLLRAIDIAAELESDCVSLWSGVVPADTSRNEAEQRLLDGLAAVIAYAQQQGVRLGFEPEPGMLIDTMSRFEAFLAAIESDHVQLTLDVGHLHCQGEAPIPAVIHRWGNMLVNVHLEDMRVGVHEHLMFGEGEMDFPPILSALADADYSGGVHVELSRHSHDGPRAARQAFNFLVPLLKRGGEH